MLYPINKLFYISIDLIEKFHNSGITTTADVLAKFRTKSILNNFCSENRIDRDELVHIYAICDIIRIRGIGLNTAHRLVYQDSILGCQQLQRILMNENLEHKLSGHYKNIDTWLIELDKIDIIYRHYTSFEVEQAKTEFRSYLKNTRMLGKKAKIKMLKFVFFGSLITSILIQIVFSYKEFHTREFHNTILAIDLRLNEIVGREQHNFTWLYISQKAILLARSALIGFGLFVIVIITNTTFFVSLIDILLFNTPDLIAHYMQEGKQGMKIIKNKGSLNLIALFVLVFIFVCAIYLGVDRFLDMFRYIMLIIGLFVFLLLLINTNTRKLEISVDAYYRLILSDLIASFLQITVSYGRFVLMILASYSFLFNVKVEWLSGYFADRVVQSLPADSEYYDRIYSFFNGFSIMSKPVFTYDELWATVHPIMEYCFFTFLCYIALSYAIDCWRYAGKSVLIEITIGAFISLIRDFNVLLLNTPSSFIVIFQNLFLSISLAIAINAIINFVLLIRNRLQN